MDPSSGRDRNSNSSPSEPENPFIRFKNFADAQVSSLLQGIIGLPSAISRRSSEQTGWADVDEDLRRRDELHERQKALISQWREATDKASGNSMAVEIPVKKSPQYQASPTSEPTSSHWHKLIIGQASLTGDNKDNSKLAQDLPLYSPVTKELFDDFNSKDVEDLMSNGLFSSFAGLQRGLDMPRPALDSTTVIKSLSLTMLKISDSFHSEYSLLPYLLFSPYSPIKLEEDERYSTIRKRNDTRYCAAFEDLIRTTQGRESSTQSIREAERFSKASLFNLPGQNHSFWIMGLFRDGILQQKRQASDPAPDLKTWRAIGAHGSDLDMFEHIERFVPRFLGPLAPLFLTGSFPISEVPPNVRIFTAKELQDGKSLPYFPDADSENRVALNARNGKDGLSEKVLMTSTTTERTTHEDGTVETTLTIWKQYGDGRESTTTTHHIDEPAWSDRESTGNQVDERAPKQEQKEVEKDEKKEKKGWFWN